MLEKDKKRYGYSEGETVQGTNLQEDYVARFDKFIDKMHSVNQETYTGLGKKFKTKDRNKFVESEIRQQAKIAKQLGLDKYTSEYIENAIKEKDTKDKATKVVEEVRANKAEGGILDQDRYGMKDGGPGIEALRKEAPEVVERMGYEDGGEIDDQMLMVMTPPMESEMESDDNMEDNYTRFIMEEALSEEEEDMLTSKLEQDEELSMLFDKIIDVAQEFAGSGPVEGPGSGVSDSIPARLSDGEFVFTAKAVEEIGEDTLMSMMKDAEANADERQGLAEGGMPEDNNVNVQADALLGMDMSPDPTQEAINENMIKYQPYVRS
jgi:hypothetical protein